MTIFDVGQSYTRADVQEALNVPQERRGGNWDTGYTEYDGAFYVFCNIGTAGRTGHDYENYWDGNSLVWRAKNGTNLRQPQVVNLLSGVPVHVFHREQDRSAFVYAGLAHASTVEDLTPVQVHWSFDRASPGSIGRSAVIQILSERGFVLEKKGVKTQKATLRDMTVYIKQESNRFVLVIPPSWEDRTTELTTTGAVRPRDRFFYHNSTMLAFPRRLNSGRDKIPFGIDFDFPDHTSLSRFLTILSNGSSRPVEEQTHDRMNIDPRTETETTRAIRLGQQKFRQALLERYRGRCALTDIDMPELLRASHITPWCDSTPKERHDPDNGLLLAVHIDGLFDRGLISFADDGSILLAPSITEAVLSTFGLSSAMVLKVSSRTRDYLERHRKKHFGS